MAFKLISEIRDKQDISDESGKILEIGKTIKCKASIASDEEGKFWAPGKVKIKVLDADTLLFSWGIRKISLHMSVAGASPESSGFMEMIKMKWESDEEKVFKKVGPVDLSDHYHKGPFFNHRTLIHF